MEKRATWASRTTFILAAIGSAVGLGNAWRFPGLCAKYGGGAFLLVYLIAMLALGIPLLMMEIAIGRKVRKGAPGAMRALNKGFEPIGWASVSNAFVIACYYSIVFAWVIMMFVFSFKFAGMTGNADAASNLFADLTETTWGLQGWQEIPTVVICCAVAAWALIYLCIRNGAHSVGKVVKFTVFAPVACLVAMAVKGLTMPGAMDGIYKLFVPDFAALYNPQLWVDAVGQVFYSLSIMMAIMIAYGSFLDKESNIAVDGMIIAFSDMAISVLSGIVMFATMGGVGKLDEISASGISTAFIIYPQAIVNLTNSGVFNAIFGGIFYLCLITLAVDSAFSIIEGVSTAIADKFDISHKKTTAGVVLAGAAISLVFTTKAGVAWLDIVDNWANQYNLVFVGIVECIAIGWFFKTSKVHAEVNKNTNKFKMPEWWFNLSIKVVAPVLLTGLFVWNLVVLFRDNDGVYGYSKEAEFIGGWAVSGLVLISGFVMMFIGFCRRKVKKLDKTNDLKWDEIPDDDGVETEAVVEDITYEDAKAE